MVLARRAQMGLDFTYDAAKPFDAVGKAGVLFCHLHTAYALTGNEQYADKMTEYVRALLKATPNEKLFKNDFYAGDLLYILTHTYDICNDRLTDAERQQTKQLVLKAAQGHHWTQRTGYVENHIFDNHYWQRAFREMLQVGLLFANEDNQAKEVLVYCYELWTARAPASGFNRDGEWHNGHGYFDANLKTLYYVPSLLSHIAKNDFLQHPWYQKAGQALVYTWAPQSKSAGFGDGSEKGVDPNRQRVAFADFLARETGDMYSGWYANQCSNTLRQDLDLRLYRMASLHTYPTDLPQDAPKFVWYKDAGELAMHSHLDAPEKDLTLGFRSSTFGSGSHTLSNQNAFNLLFRGVDVYRSSGYYLNFSDAHNLMSYRHTRAHNTILVNGIGQPYSTKGYGNIARVLGGKHITYCLGDASKAKCAWCVATATPFNAATGA